MRFEPQNSDEKDLYNTHTITNRLTKKKKTQTHSANVGQQYLNTLHKTDIFLNILLFAV